MKTNRSFYLIIASLAIMLASSSCKKDSSIDSSSLYVPTSADVTSTASLDELQQGRTLYMNNCNSCHQLYLPEAYTPSQWKNNILPGMTRRTSLTTAQVQLVTKYLCKGK